ncbi:MAG: tRNA (adenosine(37)-N6)-threonylcarbamoyltransferase complex dimerization subunit type 1 TsaB [Clostridia bacterium]|nr:tRNA (adenosine(37)-N6)-threonylcarbamoyltransferase complex dimerization subunit type 1 TsaB [Clostridia bacterium]
MKILALESSALSAGAAVLTDGVLVSEQFVNNGLTHSATLAALADKALADAGTELDGVDAIAVSAGPGSFTGVRIGVSLAKGLAFGAGKPVYGASSLEALARLVCPRPGLVCPVMDARRGEFYNALFSYEGDRLLRLTPDRAIPAVQLARELGEEQTVLIGDGAAKAAELIPDLTDGGSESGRRIFCAPASVRFARASGVALCAWESFLEGDMGVPADALRPSYLRLSQAERERAGKGSQNSLQSAAPDDAPHESEE